MEKTKKVGRPYKHFFLLKEGELYRAVTASDMNGLLANGEVQGQVVRVRIESTYEVKNAKQELIEI